MAKPIDNNIKNLGLTTAASNEDTTKNSQWDQFTIKIVHNHYPESFCFTEYGTSLVSGSVKLVKVSSFVTLRIPAATAFIIT